eukprot:scaffold44420_cov66-Phaeocystis_antarctica.AAC.2
MSGSRLVTHPPTTPQSTLETSLHCASTLCGCLPRAPITDVPWVYDLRAHNPQVRSHVVARHRPALPYTPPTTIHPAPCLIPRCQKQALWIPLRCPSAHGPTPDPTPPSPRPRRAVPAARQRRPPPL